MSDQCRTCTCRGKMELCESTPCFQRENWWAQEKIKQFAELGWKDISTPPKDYQHVLIAGEYVTGIPYVEESYRFPDGHYSGRKYEPPTHWMELPDPPAEEETL
jgi:hypothetical protein